MTTRPVALAVPLAAGAATALVLGVYAAAHEPTGRDFVLSGFDSSSAWKSAFASITMVLFVVQITLGLRVTGRIGPRQPAPPWSLDLHRLVGTIAFGFSIPVVFHCIWTLGYQSGDSRVAAHSVLGCIAYGLYVAKIIGSRNDERPVWALPVIGSLLGFAMLATWWGSALVHYAGSGA